MTVTGAHTNASIHVVWVLPSEPASVSLARRQLGSLMATHPHAQMDDAVLATSELVTNAIVHGKGAVTVHVLQGMTVLRVEVTDQGEATPLPRYDAHHSADSGRTRNQVGNAAESRRSRHNRVVRDESRSVA
jgi:anti-sigma regulatory factor (Ser/Thr protein kinase)